MSPHRASETGPQPVPSAAPERPAPKPQQVQHVQAAAPNPAPASVPARDASQLPAFLMRPVRLPEKPVKKSAAKESTVTDA